MKHIFYLISKSSFLVISLFIFLLCMFGSTMSYYYKLDVSSHNLLILSLAFLIFGLLLSVTYYLSKKIKLNSRWTIWALSLVLFLLQLLLMYSYFFETGWDAGRVVRTAFYLSGYSSSAENFNEYYSLYPNNLFLAVLFSKIFVIAKWLGLSQGIAYFILLTLQSFFNVLTGLLIFSLIEKLLKKTYVAFVGYWFYLLLIWFSPWVSIPYSDSMGLIFPITLLYLFSLLENGKYTLQKSISIGVVAGVGYAIKPQTFIMFIAIVLVSFILFGFRDMKWLKNLVVIIFSLLLVRVGIGYFATTDKIILNQEREISYTHFIKMGLNNATNGGFYGGDAQDSANEHDKTKRRKQNLETIQVRLNDYGIGGLVNHQVKKTLNNYNDGTFTWGKEGEFFYGMREEHLILDRLTRGLYYPAGKYENTYKYIVQGVWLLILFLQLANLVKSSKNQSTIFMVMAISLIGLFLFESIFEARARYLYTYSPIFIVVAMFGLGNSLDYLRKTLRKSHIHQNEETKFMS